MTGLAGRMPEVDSLIFGVLGETLVSGTDSTKGAFFRRYREIEYASGTVVGLALSFDCQIQPWIAALAEGDPVTVDGNPYRFLRRIPAGGDESGLVTLELGTAL